MNARQKARTNLPTPEEKKWFDHLFVAFGVWQQETPTTPRDEILGHLLVESGVQDELGRHQLSRVTRALSTALGTKEPK